SRAARYAASACTGRPARGASARAATAPAATRASPCSTVSTERPLHRAIRPTSSPSAAALTISSRSRTRRVRSVRRSCCSTSARCWGDRLLSMAVLLGCREGHPGARVPAAYLLHAEFTSVYLAWIIHGGESERRGAARGVHQGDCSPGGAGGAAPEHGPSRRS